jgi:RIO kinase 1
LISPRLYMPQVTTIHKMTLKRDIRDITTFLSRYTPELAYTGYGTEIWSLFQNGKLNLGVNLTGYVEQKHKPINLNSVLVLRAFQ